LGGAIEGKLVLGMRGGGGGGGGGWGGGGGGGGGGGLKINVINVHIRIIFNENFEKSMLKTISIDI
jgi:hypothetical protein